MTTQGTAVAPAKAERTMPRPDPFRLLRTRPSRLPDEPFNLFRTFAPFLEEDLPLTAWTPLCDVFETAKEIVIKAELPGVEKENLHVNVEHNVLTLRGERRLEEETTRENYHRVERSYGEFMRSFTLPTTVDPNRIQAAFTDGVLTVTLPKREEALSKQIEVRVA